MRSFLSRLFGFGSEKGKRERRTRRRRWAVEQLEVRTVMAATGILVNEYTDQVIHGGSIISFPYSGGPSGTFSMMGAGGLPVPFFPSPGMPPRDGRNGVWEFVGTGDVNGDGKVDMVAKDSGIASVTPSKNGQVWVALNTGIGNNDQFNFTLWDGAIPSFSAVGSGTSQITWGDHQVADFTGDGKADFLARVRETGKWYLWTTNSTGTGFTTQATGLTAKSSLFGTWNNTIVVDSLTSHHYQWRDALVGDFDADGKMDLAGRRITNATGASAFDEWYVGLGTATTTDRGDTNAPVNSWWNITSWQHDTTVSYNDTTWANAVLGDFNNDGLPDIAGRMAYPTLPSGTRPGEWWVSYTPSTVGAKVSPVPWADWNHAVNADQLHWRDVQAGDFNNDGWSDILGRTRFGEWHLVDGFSGTSSVVGTWGTDYQQYPVVVAGDFTGDGKIDLAARKQGSMEWHLSAFTGSSFPIPTARGGMTMLYNTLREDFFVKGTPQGYVGSSLPLALLQDLSRFNPPPSSFKDPQFIVGRYNADGSLDFEGYGGGATIMSSAYYRVHLDFNGDDLPDIMSQFGDDSWLVSTNHGNSYVTTSSNLTWPVNEYRTVLIGDFTGDHKDDLLSQHAIDPLNSEWYLHASRGDGTFTTDLILTRTYLTEGDHVWLVDGDVGDFDNDGRDDVVHFHKENDDPYDPTWIAEVAFSNGVSPTPINPTPVQFTWDSVANWLKDVTPTAYDFLHWGIGDFNGDSVDDVWGKQMTTVIVGPPQLTEQYDQLWVGYGNGRGGGLGAGAVYTFPEPSWEINIDPRGSQSGRFDSSVDTWDDIVVEVSVGSPSTTNELRVIKSAGWTVNIVDQYGRTGGEQFAMVGDMDNDQSDDLIWIGTTPTHYIDLFVRSEIETIPWMHSGEVISGGGVPAYIWTTSPRLRKRKPN